LIYNLGVSLAFQGPPHSEISDVAGRALSRLTGRSEWRLVHELTGLLAFWVADLPASEKYHHSRPFGLLEHSTEVAATLARNLDRRWNSGKARPKFKREERSIWARVAYITALLHDVGKVMDVTVSDPGGRVEWDPLEEPLALFKRRCNLAFVEPCGFRYRSRRGTRGHEAKTLIVARRILSMMSWSDLAPFVPGALAAYADRHVAGAPRYPAPLEYLAARVQEADVQNGLWGWDARGSSSPRYSRFLPIGGPR
jgi:hypothetical protein